jgi:hypothetical protein
VTSGPTSERLWVASGLGDRLADKNAEIPERTYRVETAPVSVIAARQREEIMFLITPPAARRVAVATQSSICKAGITFRCDDGEWRNLGTPCE